jgi:hypothetical protein
MPSLSHFSFTLELEGLRYQGSSNDMTYLYQVLPGVQWILLHALPDIVTTQNPYSLCMIQPSDDLQESSQFMVMGLGQKCKVTLWYKLFSLRTLQNLITRMLIRSFLILKRKEKKESWMFVLLTRSQLMFWSAQKIVFGGLWLLIGSENFPITRVFNYRTYLIKIDSVHSYVQEITLFYPRIRMLKIQGW